ncbi:hypothetical protein C8J57DRAFT_1232768 [Mycena rebaudengoi]|nr:hypothetical protein C8J57DRAFT_1232768 [Mycena rebaudengoi]
MRHREKFTSSFDSAMAELSARQFPPFSHSGSNSELDLLSRRIMVRDFDQDLLGTPVAQNGQAVPTPEHPSVGETATCLTLRTMANITGRYFGGIWLLMYLTYTCNILAQYILNIPAWYMLGIL